MFVFIAFLIVASLIVTVAIFLREGVSDGWEDSDGFHKGIKP